MEGEAGDDGPASLLTAGRGRSGQVRATVCGQRPGGPKLEVALKSRPVPGAASRRRGAGMSGPCLPSTYGASATSWPMLAAPAADVATFVPVEPVVALPTSAPSTVTLKVPALEATSPRSAMPVGAVKVVASAVPKNPITWAFALVVVIEGAVTDALDALNWPPLTSTGVTVLTPL